METRRLGSRGPVISVVGLGGNNFGMKLDRHQSHAVIAAALDRGITHFDTAEVYGEGRSETLLGEALGRRRDQVVIATKFAPRPQGEDYRPGLLRRRILEGCEGSLRRLGTDRIDIYYQHRPDPAAPVEETLETLYELIDSGKIMYAACSNYSAHQIEEAARVSAGMGKGGFVACQFHWNLLARDAEEELAPAVRAQGMGIVPYYPLESGLLTGKYGLGEEFPRGSRLAIRERYAAWATPETMAYVEKLRTFALGRGRPLLDLAFGWLLAQQGVASVIAGATTPEQVAENAAAGNSWRLTEEDLQAIPPR